MNTLSDFSPQMLPDGRVLFTRWEYIDRDLTYRQSLWTQNPDGTGYQLYFGNTIRDVGTFWQARPLPGPQRPGRGHVRAAPRLPARGHRPDRPQLRTGRAQGQGLHLHHPGVSRRSATAATSGPTAIRSRLSDRTFLCSYGGGGSNVIASTCWTSTTSKRLIYEDPRDGLLLPAAAAAGPGRRRCSRARVEPPPQPPDVRRPRTRWGPSCWPTSTADWSRRSAAARSSTCASWSRSARPRTWRSRAYDQSPVMSYGTYYAKRCWGTVPVEEDGSAHFRSRRLREIYFQALDAEGRELQRMTSAVQVMPGERVSCIGCHEPRQSVAAWPRPAAAGRAASAAELETPGLGPRRHRRFPQRRAAGARQVLRQCHQRRRPGRRLRPERRQDPLLQHGLRQPAGPQPLLPAARHGTRARCCPTEQAKGKPLVHFYWLLRTPTAVNQPLWTGCHASRLLDYVDTRPLRPADPAGGPAADLPLDRRQRALLRHLRPQPAAVARQARPVRPTWPPASSRRGSPSDFLGVYNRRCAELSRPVPGAQRPRGHLGRPSGLDQLQQPAVQPRADRPPGQSRPAAAASDSRATAATRPSSPITADPDYQTMLQAIQARQASGRRDPRGRHAGLPRRAAGAVNNVVADFGRRIAPCLYPYAPQGDNDAPVEGSANQQLSDFQCGHHAPP